MEANVNPSVDQERIRKEEIFHPLVLSRVYTASYQKEGTVTAEIKQTVDSKAFYPSKSVSSNLQDNPFSTEEFGFGGQEYSSSSVRVAWIDVPENSTPEQVQAKLQTLPKARLYRILSNHPIISDRQEYAIANKVTTLDVIADRQAVRYPLTHATHAGKLIMDTNGKPQYKGVFFKSSFMEDIDRRTKIRDDFYATPAMVEEMTGVVSQSMTTL